MSKSRMYGLCLFLPAVWACSGSPAPAPVAPPSSELSSPPSHAVNVASTSASATAQPTAIPAPPLHPTPVELVPERVRNAYPSVSARGVVDFERTATGWNISLAAPPSTDANRGEWAGFCWDIAAVDASSFSSLGLELPEVAKGEEVEVKLERTDNGMQETLKRFLVKGETRVDLTGYPRVRPEIGRLCIMAVGRPSAKAASTAKFAFARAWLE